MTSRATAATRRLQQLRRRPSRPIRSDKALPRPATFVSYRDALGLPAALVPHSIRHSYVSHLTENGLDRRFIQCQVGHEADSSTAIYTHVSSDFMNTALCKALAPALELQPTETEQS